jgi:phosphopantetheinyl transferase
MIERLSRLELIVPGCFAAVYVNSQGCDEYRNTKTIEGFSIEASLCLNKLQDTVNLGVISFKKHENGQPYAINPAGNLFGVSISHTTGIVIAVLSACYRVGIDAEKTDRKVSDALIRRIMHPDEVFDEQTPPIKVWTMKEAVLKLTGSGLRKNMNSLRLLPCSELGYITTVNDDTITVQSFQFSNYWISLAYSTIE